MNNCCTRCVSGLVPAFLNRRDHLLRLLGWRGGPDEQCGTTEALSRQGRPDSNLFWEVIGPILVGESQDRKLSQEMRNLFPELRDRNAWRETMREWLAEETDSWKQLVLDFLIEELDRSSILNGLFDFDEEEPDRSDVRQEEAD